MQIAGLAYLVSLLSLTDPATNSSIDAIGVAAAAAVTDVPDLRVRSALTAKFHSKRLSPTEERYEALDRPYGYTPPLETMQYHGPLQPSVQPSAYISPRLVPLLPVQPTHLKASPANLEARRHRKHRVSTSTIYFPSASPLPKPTTIATADNDGPLAVLLDFQHATETETLKQILTGLATEVSTATATLTGIVDLFTTSTSSTTALAQETATALIEKTQTRWHATLTDTIQTTETAVQMSTSTSVTTTPVFSLTTNSHTSLALETLSQTSTQTASSFTTYIVDQPMPSGWTAAAVATPRDVISAHDDEPTYTITELMSGTTTILPGPADQTVDVSSVNSEASELLTMGVITQTMPEAVVTMTVQRPLPSVIHYSVPTTYNVNRGQFATFTATPVAGCDTWTTVYTLYPESTGFAAPTGNVSTISQKIAHHGGKKHHYIDAPPADIQTICAYHPKMAPTFVAFVPTNIPSPFTTTLTMNKTTAGFYCGQNYKKALVNFCMAKYTKPYVSSYSMTATNLAPTWPYPAVVTTFTNSVSIPGGHWGAAIGKTFKRDNSCNSEDTCLDVCKADRRAHVKWFGIIGTILGGILLVAAIFAFLKVSRNSRQRRLEKEMNHL
ncbi:hypothetical protein MRB53_037383 [Persea americana]|nr:hypothetical protein MRB53_037383 [Persea americana]